MQQLSERVAKINSTQEAGPSLAAEVTRSTDRLTVVRMTVAHADIMQLEVLAQELYRDREQLRPVAERQPGIFLRVDYPLAKDFNKELEYTAQGLSAEQIRLTAQRDEQQRETERQARLAAAQRLEREQRTLEREAQRARENTPEAQKERQQDDKRFHQAVVGAAGAGRPDNPDNQRPFRSYRSKQEAAEHTAQFVHARDAGLVLLKEYLNDNPPPTGRKVDEAEQEELRGRARYAESAVAVSLPTGPPAEEKTATWKIDEVAANTTGRAEAWKEILDSSGYSMRTSEVRSTVDERGIRRAEFDMTYHNDQPDVAIIHAIVTNTNARAEAGNEKYASVRVAESDSDRAARQAAAEAAAIQPHNRDRSLDVAVKSAERVIGQEVMGDVPGSEKQIIIKVNEPAPTAGERGQAEAVRVAVTDSGAQAGDLQSTTDERGIRHSQMRVSYRTDQPDLARISHTLDAVGAQPGSQLIEHSSDRAERRELARSQEVERPVGAPEITR
ncbi:MAG: hypothetical protein NVS3B25_30710 [Hymenobacter sp.]